MPHDRVCSNFRKYVIDYGLHLMLSINSNSSSKHGEPHYHYATCYIVLVLVLLVCFPSSLLSMHTLCIIHEQRRTYDSILNLRRYAVIFWDKKTAWRISLGFATLIHCVFVQCFWIYLFYKNKNYVTITTT